MSVEGATVGEVLVALAGQYPGLSGQVLTEDGTLHKFVNVYSTTTTSGTSQLDTPVGDGDESRSCPPWPEGPPTGVESRSR